MILALTILMTMKIVIDGEPVAQTRMKYSARGGFGRIYDPRAKEKDKIKELMASYVKRFYIGHKMLEHPRLSFIFHMPIPKSIPKKDRALYESGLLKHEKKPDVDNLIKLYLDCLDGIAIEGDQKVSLGPCLKLYHPDPKMIVWIHETSNKIQPWELDSSFLGASESDIPSFCVQDYPYGSESLWFQVRSLFDRSLIPDNVILT